MRPALTQVLTKPFYQHPALDFMGHELLAKVFVDGAVCVRTGMLEDVLDAHDLLAWIRGAFVQRTID